MAAAVFPSRSFSILTADIASSATVKGRTTRSALFLLLQPYVRDKMVVNDLF